MAIIDVSSSTIQDLKEVLKENQVSTKSLRINVNIG